MADPPPWRAARAGRSASGESRVGFGTTRKSAAAALRWRGASTTSREAVPRGRGSTVAGGDSAAGRPSRRRPSDRPGEGARRDNAIARAAAAGRSLLGDCERLDLIAPTGRAAGGAGGRAAAACRAVDASSSPVSRRDSSTGSTPRRPWPRNSPGAGRAIRHAGHLICLSNRADLHVPDRSGAARARASGIGCTSVELGAGTPIGAAGCTQSGHGLRSARCEPRGSEKSPKRWWDAARPRDESDRFRRLTPSPRSQPLPPSRRLSTAYGASADWKPKGGTSVSDSNQ